MKSLPLLLLVLFCFFCIGDCEPYNCQFGYLYGDRSVRLTSKPEYSNENAERNNARSLQGLTRNSIRITLDTSDFLTLKASEDGANQTTTTKLDFIKRAMQVAQRFYQLRLKVTPRARVYAPVLCQDHTPPSTDQSNGISNSDLHIYVLYVTSQVKTYGATGISCNVVTTGLGFPDTTLQQGRPDVGRMIFNTYRLVDKQASLTNRLFASVAATALHQTLHILGFDSYLYSTYLVDSTGNKHASTTTTIQYYPTRSVTTLLTTPYVTAWAKDFFGCNTITGMQLQDEDGATVGSHWERLVMYDQLMTGTAIGAQKGVSSLTFALLKDMGWYEVDDRFNDTTNYGYHKGCQLWENGCNSSTVFDYFCDPTALSGYVKCASNFLSKAQCYDANGANSNGLMSNRCSMLFPYFHCVDSNQVDDGYKAYALETYGTSSFCVTSTMGSVSLQSQYQARCYPYVCHSSNTSIVFTLSTYTIVCSSTDAGNQKTSSGLSGYLICPVYEDYCVQSRKICKNWCSKNGFCMRGVCNCLSGYSGQDCSITTCTSTQFYNPTTGTCGSSCVSGTYQNIYTRTCMPCDSKCLQCRDQPTICTSCPVTNPQQYFYQDQCLNTCPSTTYIGGTNGDTCIDCDSTTSFCVTCVYAATNCTSCSNADGTDRFLYPTDGTSQGTCGTTCSGFYSYKDVVNFKCVAACQQNLIDKGGNICDKCDLGQYKKSNGVCSATCDNGYYPDATLRQCIQCDASCKACDGQFSENCTSCDPNSMTNQKYWLLKMCLTQCPRGFYPNDIASTCDICPVDKYCSSCLDNGVDIQCTTCKYGFFYQVNKTCTQDCDPDRYKNTWNHSCDLCSTQCKTCTGPQDNSCLSCDTSKLFLTNITGGYCLGTCPTTGYVSDGTNCRTCHFTCDSCNGQASTNCITCKSSLYKSDNICRYVCPANYYQNKDTKTCDACDSTCLYCTGPSASQCLICNTNTYLYNSTCLTSCPANLPANKWNVCFSFHQLLNIVFGLALVIIAY